MRRVRFAVLYSAEDLKKMEENENYTPDTRAMAYPTLYPAWCSGSSFTADIWVAYAPDEGTEAYIKELWPEFNGSFDFNDPVERIETYDRFPIDYKIYDADGRALTPGQTAAQMQAAKAPANMDVAETLAKLPCVTAVVITNDSNPKDAAKALYDMLNGKSSGGLSD